MSYYNDLYSTFWCGYAHIYSLSDSHGNVFYVGCTTKTIESRLRDHLTEAHGNKFGNKEKNELIRSLSFNINATLLESMWVTGYRRCFAVNKASALEVKWMNHFMSLGCNLVNKYRSVIVGRTLVHQDYIKLTQKDKEAMRQNLLSSTFKI